MDREATHRLVITLKEMVISGTIKLQEDSLASLSKVTFAQDGLVDLDTVDSNVRATGLVALYMKERQELKATPLLDVQRIYFQILEDQFGTLFKRMHENRANEHDFAEYLVNQPNNLNQFTENYPKFMELIKSFWNEFGQVVHAHVEDLNCLKAVFGGDIFPSYTKNIASNIGLYVDTIVLPDPILRANLMEQPARPEALMFYTLKHALNVMKYQNLALAQVETPIVVISPYYSQIDSNIWKLIATAADEDIRSHLSRMFGIEFENLADAYAYVDSLARKDSPLSSIADSSRLLINQEWELSLEGQIRRYIDETKINFERITLRSLSNMIKSITLSRFLQANELVISSSRYGGVPLIEAPTSWQYLVWKYEYDIARSISPEETKHSLIMKALQTPISNELAFIGNVPDDALITLRNEGALAGLREILWDGIKQLDNASEETFNEVAEQVTNNLTNALTNHKSMLNDLASSRKKFYGFDVLPWIMTGTVAMVAAGTGNPILQMITTGMGVCRQSKVDR